MPEFIELHKLIDDYSKEISEILNGLTDEDMENLEYLYDRLNSECLKRLKRLNEFIHSEYPLEGPVTINGITRNTANTSLNFLAQHELSKRYGEFHNLCLGYLQRYEQESSNGDNP